MSFLHLGRIVAAFQRPVRSRNLAWAEPFLIGPVPVTLGGRAVTQVDGTTCGATVLLMLRASGDPQLAAELDEHPHSIAAKQLAIFDHIRSHAVGPLRWPRRFGSPPWTLAREAVFPGVTYRSVAVNDRSRDGREILSAVWNANRAGIPVPLYTGGNVGQGIARAVPRHVVLAVPPSVPSHERKLRIYEPSTGTLVDIALDDLVNRTAPHPALGGWTHVVWAVLPTPTARIATR
ncbi:hypothetical protein [Flaviflexus huanghaiensis]|uniref:hypothetical protein n=1 Tax=Flaviflexus huanghaiensis TaxID=1111473 RepID=UPI0015FD588C|nr:hypothetical protein [Flaviflexus huanghaiensis]